MKYKEGMDNIMRIFTPRYVFRNVTSISVSFLRSRGIKALVLDVDNTLTEHGSQHLRPEIAAWLETMKAAGIKMMIASNNYKKRVQPFAARLGMDYISFSCKPSPIWLIKARKRWGLKKSQIALVGDQIFTDGLAGNLYGATVLLVRPMAKDTKATIRLKRKLEKPFLLRYYKKGGPLY